METRKQAEAPVHEEDEGKLQNTSGYYVPPSTRSLKPGKSHSTQLEIDDHKYHNSTLNGKAGLLYEVESEKGNER